MIRMNRGIVLAAVLVLGAGCASMPPVAGAPIADVGVIAGKWAGTVTPGDVPFYLTINPGGTLTAEDRRAWLYQLGKLRALGGNPNGAYEGSIRLYDEGGTRRLVLDDQWAAFNAQVAPQ